jgi:hypothetical protein
VNAVLFDESRKHAATTVAIPRSSSAPRAPAESRMSKRTGVGVPV